MKFTGESKIFIGILLGTMVIIGSALRYFSQPEPKLSKDKLILFDSQTKGNPNAKTFLVEFSDFQCPACKAFVPVVEELTSTYKDKLLFTYRYFPLDQHPFGQTAAKAAQAAAVQGKFWEMAALLFANQERFSPTLWEELADEIKLNKAEFDTAMNSSETEKKIQEDRNFGVQIGVNATPTFFLNGEKLEARTFDEFKQKVKEAIEQSPS